MSQLLECTLDWNIAINAKQSVDIVYLHYAKAFDSVVHNKLLMKLQCYGQLLSWIKSFLSNRKQYVKIGPYCSTASGQCFGPGSFYHICK